MPDTPETTIASESAGAELPSHDCSRLLSTAIDCHRLLSTAIDCYRLPSTAIDCHRLPSTAIDCYRLPSTAIDCHRPGRTRRSAPTRIDCSRLLRYRENCLQHAQFGATFFVLTSPYRPAGNPRYPRTPHPCANATIHPGVRTMSHRHISCHLATAIILLGGTAAMKA